jgi:hypothetical protein
MQHKNQASKIKKTPLELQKDPHSSRPSSVGTIPSTRKDIQLRIPAEENELPGEKTLGSRNACYVKKSSRNPTPSMAQSHKKNTR